MPKYPLPADTFPTLDVSDDDAEALMALSADFVGTALVEYGNFCRVERRVVSEARWKPVKTRDGVTVYQDRTVKITKSSTFENDAVVGSMSFSTKLHGVLGIGTIDGSLDDMMYGLLRPSSELMKIKSVYMDDSGSDAKVLATIISPSVEDPVRSLQLKWTLSDFVTPILRRIVRPRDFVYLESLQYLEAADGERVGCILMHSIQIPGVRELTDHQVVRGSLSFLGLYRQLPHDKLDFYMKGFVDSRGEIHKAVAVPGTVEAMLSFRRAVYCASMKKLNYALKTQNSVIVDVANALCCSCSASLRPPSSADRICEVCMGRTCNSCLVHRVLCFYTAAQRKTVTKRIGFCRRCQDKAQAVGGLEIAAEEARRRNPLVAFEVSSDSSRLGVISPTESASVDVQREFFG